MKIFKTSKLKGFGKKYSGKTRDFYIKNGKRILISTDRISAFDKIIGYIPNKGQVLNQLSSFWFEKTKNIIANHFLSMPHPNAMIVKECKIIPIEMVVRGYITGVTSTSIWGSYEKGEREIYAIKFPDNLQKNQKLPTPIITPTTKAAKGHDERLTEKEIFNKRICSKKTYSQMKKISLKLFENGSKICDKNGLILVDTKYEFGIDEKGKLTLIDEIHTPDSSRFWEKSSYKKKFVQKKEPRNFDKEFLRIWLKKKEKNNKSSIAIPPAFAKKVSQRYIRVYEDLSKKKFRSSNKNSIEEQINKSFRLYL
jgi:phosphoribosylaminoimidazole-succinocarboxamide synthase